MSGEQELTGRIVRGDRSAMKEFYDLYSGYLTAVCCRYITGRDDVKDVLQESFIKIFGSIDRFEYRGAGALKAWAGRIVVNESLKHLKSHKRLRTSVPADDFAEIIEEREPDLEDIPASVILNMVRSLPDGYRTVFNLYVFEKKSHREIASILNIAENSSASQFHRAKGVLIRRIKEYGTKIGQSYG